MIELKSSDIQKYKKILNDDGVFYSSENDYAEATQNMYSLCELMYEIANEELSRKKHLLKHPDGFYIEAEGRCCAICRNCINGRLLYDKWGMKCDSCQSAIKKKIIPNYVASDKDYKKHYTANYISSRYRLHHRTINKMIRNKTLKARIVPNGPTLFLFKENPRIDSVLSETK